MNREKERVKIGILGCGVISSAYIKNIQVLYQPLEIAALADSDLEKAKARAAEFGIETWCDTNGLLENEEITIIVNLTPPKFHYDLNRKILMAGKNLFCEKPFAFTLEQAEELEALANERGLIAGGAPDTFLEPGLLRTGLLLERGAIGRPLYVSAAMMSYGVETWHPDPAQFYQEGAGPLYDMGPYYLTAIVSLLGPIAEITAMAGTGFDKRIIYSQPLAGNEFSVGTPTYYTVLLKLAGGQIVSLTVSFDIWKSTLPMFEIYGTEGTLSVPDPNMSAGMPVVVRKEEVLAKRLGTPSAFERDFPGEEELKRLYPEHAEYTRGAGVLDLAEAVKDHRPPKAGMELICHVLEAINGIMATAESGKRYLMKTTCGGHKPWTDNDSQTNTGNTVR